MARDASDLAHRLAREAEAVCRHYLSNGRRQGNYWLVGDVRNTPGRSMFVRLKGGESGKGAAGKWTDAAEGDHGDLLDVIRESCGFADFRDVANEARRFLSLPRSDPEPERRSSRAPAPSGSTESARRLFAMSRPIMPALSLRPICANAASRTCAEPRVFVSIRAAITGRAMTRRPRIGRR